MYHTSHLQVEEIQRDAKYADIYLLLNNCTCFGHPSRPSSGLHETVFAASGTDRTIWGTNFLKRDKIRSGLGPSNL